MPADFLVHAPIALAPVLMFLAVLLHFDSYKLVSFVEVLETLLAGAALAGVCYLANSWAMDSINLDFSDYSRFIAPVLEEVLKASALIYLLARNRIGFKIDAAIMGFAVGTGFALIENLYYLYSVPDPNLGLWLIRGFGTAIMHGGTTALFGVVAQFFIDRHGRLNPLYLLPGLAAAIALHALFNHFDANPLLATALMIVGLPPGFFLVFTKSARGVHTWLVSDYESHEHLLDEIKRGTFKDSEVGQFIMKLDVNFGPDTVAQMFLYIQVHTELVLRAEQISLARETTVQVTMDPKDRERLQQLHGLERDIGRTALMALWPHLHFSRRELWELHELKDEVRHA